MKSKLDRNRTFLEMANAYIAGELRSSKVRLTVDEKKEIIEYYCKAFPTAVEDEERQEMLDGFRDEEFAVMFVANAADAALTYNETVQEPTAEEIEKMYNAGGKIAEIINANQDGYAFAEIVPHLAELFAVDEDKVMVFARIENTHTFLKLVRSRSLAVVADKINLEKKSKKTDPTSFMPPTGGAEA